MARKDRHTATRKRSTFGSFTRASPSDDQDQSQRDIVILLLGVTGAGKSTFINDVLGYRKAPVFDNLQPILTPIQPYTTSLPPESECKQHCKSRLVLVDTPGFDSSDLQDSEILDQVQAWLTKSYGGDAKFSAIVYLHDISEKRIRHSTYMNLDRLRTLCGENPQTKVILATTHWDETKPEDGISREEELRTIFWNELLNAQNTNMMRLDQATRRRDVCRVIDFILDITPTPILRGLNSKIEPSKKSERWKKIVRSEDTILEDGKPGDLIIAVMGSTGVGKSTFINAAAHITAQGPLEDISPVGHRLESCTRNVVHHKLQLPATHPHFPNQRLILVDTPGFDDTHQDDSEILRRISVWLAHSYSENAHLTGLIYLSNIEQKRMFGSERLNIAVFRKICGKDFSTIIMGSTHWDVVRQPIAIQRETELRQDFWKELIDQGAQVCRIQETPKDAVDVINTILSTVANGTSQIKILQIQAELVDLEKSIPLTEAGTKLRHSLRELVERHRNLLDTTKDDNTREELQLSVSAALSQIDLLSVPLSDRLKNWLRIMARPLI